MTESTRHPTTDVVTKVYQELLDTASGPGDDFFDLGGHSMLAVVAMAELSAALGTELPLELIFDHPKAGALADAIDSYLHSAGPAS